jgi:DNA ligase (NAD+)
MNSKLSRKSFVFTGALETMKRPEAQKLVEDNGGINKSGVSAGLDFLVTNEISNSKKSQDAIKFGTKIINEKEFLEMLK